MEMCIINKYHLHAVSLVTSYAATYGKCVPSLPLSVKGIGTGWEEAPGRSAITTVVSQTTPVAGIGKCGESCFLIQTLPVRFKSL